MSFVMKMLNLQVMLFLLMALGILMKKVGIITPENRKSFSGLLLNVVLPCNIIHSFLGENQISAEFFENCLLALFLSLVIQVFITWFSRFLFRKAKRERRSVMSYGLICSNSSFVGLPVAEALYGSLGVLYTSIFQIPIRFTMWTAGLALFTEVDRKEALKKLIKYPCILAVFVGFFLMLLPVSLPAVILDTIHSVSKCTTPLSMFVIGAILADADIKTMFSKDVFYFTFWRLLGLPFIIFMSLKCLGLDPLLISISVIMSGMPAGSTTSILADQFGGDSMFASQVTFVSTLFSMATIPLLGIVLK